MTRWLAAPFAALCLVVAGTRVSRAQSVRVADSLLRAGSMDRAESIYYAAARVRPHDPIARWALGRYLVSRGAPRVGATLFEESLRFGGAPSLVTPDLTAAYLTAGNYAALAALPSAAPDQRMRAGWLAARSPRIVAPDSVVVALFQPSNDTTALGLIPIRVDGHTIDAEVSARVQGIVIADTGAISRLLHIFGARRGQSAPSPVLAAADSVGIGRLTMTAMPLTIDRAERRRGAVIGLDVLARFAPTFDPAASRVTLRPGGAVSIAGGQRLETLMAPPEVRIHRAGGWMSLSQPAMWRMLRQHRWTLDYRRGEIVVEP